MKTVIENSLSGVKGDIIMTLAEQWINEGFRQGVQKGMQDGVREGLTEGIVLAVRLKFGVCPESDKLIEIIENIKEIERIKAVKNAIIKARTVSELIEVLSK